MSNEPAARNAEPTLIPKKRKELEEEDVLELKGLIAARQIDRTKPDKIEELAHKYKVDSAYLRNKVSNMQSQLGITSKGGPSKQKSQFSTSTSIDTTASAASTPNLQSTQLHHQTGSAPAHDSIEHLSSCDSSCQTRIQSVLNQVEFLQKELALARSEISEYRKKLGCAPETNIFTRDVPSKFIEPVKAIQMIKLQRLPVTEWDIYRSDLAKEVSMLTQKERAENPNYDLEKRTQNKKGKLFGVSLRINELKDENGKTEFQRMMEGAEDLKIKRDYYKMKVAEANQHQNMQTTAVLSNRDLQAMESKTISSLSVSVDQCAQFNWHSCYYRFNTVTGQGCFGGSDGIGKQVAEDMDNYLEEFHPLIIFQHHSLQDYSTAAKTRKATADVESRRRRFRIKLLQNLNQFLKDEGFQGFSGLPLKGLFCGTIPGLKMHGAAVSWKESRSFNSVDLAILEAKISSISFMVDQTNFSGTKRVQHQPA
ncbi:hypothetical protein HDU78_010097 [Chytriomyces hyalinus]|nr:hypothetical protein HDU78_010097 [Chytriomyces hyalinus]